MSADTRPRTAGALACVPPNLLNPPSHPPCSVERSLSFLMNTECLEATFDSFAAFGTGEARLTLCMPAAPPLECRSTRDNPAGPTACPTHAASVRGVHATKLATTSPHCPTVCAPGMHPALFGGGPAPIGGRKAGLSPEIQV